MEGGGSLRLFGIVPCEGEDASELFRKRFQGGRTNCNLNQPFELFGVLKGFDGLPNALWITAVADFQGAQHGRPERPQFSL